jgi:lipoate-protein ligase A
MALDEVLLTRVAGGLRPPTIRFWEWTQPTLVLGSHQSVRNEIDLETAAELGFGVARRISGGGTMLAEPGRTITYSIYAPETLVSERSFVESFAFLDAWAVAGLRGLGVDAGYRPINDIVSPRGKIGGAAQARRRSMVLHHTTMAYSMEPDLVWRLIRLGRETLEPRGLRSAVKEVSPLDGFLDSSLPEVVEALVESFRAGRQTVPGRLAPEELAEASTLAAEKHASPQWIHRLP